MNARGQSCRIRAVIADNEDVDAARVVLIEQRRDRLADDRRFISGGNYNDDKFRSVLNAFSLVTGPVAPGEIVTASVPGFSPAQWADIGLNVLAPLTTNPQGVQVFFDGRPAFVMRISSGQIECIAPTAIAGQRVTHVQVSIDGALSNILNVGVAPTALGLLSADGSGTGLADDQNFDGTYNSESNPAPRGSLVTIFVTGAGVTNPPKHDAWRRPLARLFPPQEFQLFPRTGHGPSARTPPFCAWHFCLLCCDSQ